MAKTEDDSKSTLFCSFCGKTSMKWKSLLLTDSLYLWWMRWIMHDIIHEEHGAVNKHHEGCLTKWYQPSVMIMWLDTPAKRILSVAVHNHYKRLANEGKTCDLEIQKSNILVGPTGCGKRFSAVTCAHAGCAFYLGRCDNANWSRLCWWGCWKYHPKAASSLWL